MVDVINSAPGTGNAVAAMSPPAIPEHKLLRLVGGGSSGQVWLARNALGTYRAVKIVQTQSRQDQKLLTREFTGIQKFEPVSRLHEGLMDILQVGVADTAEYFYCVMELADDVKTGQVIVPEHYVPRTLAYDLLQRHRMPISECVRYGSAIASALAFLHRHQLIHRDIKPSNIIFVNGFPKLADIGLVAAISEPRYHIGTDGFAPPEGVGTPQADIYALGKVLYEMSTGKDRNEYPALPSDLGDKAEDFDLIGFNKIVLRACRTKPVRRFRSAEELMAALLSFQFRTRELHRKRAFQVWNWVAGIIGMLAALGFVGFCVWRLMNLLIEGQ